MSKLLPIGAAVQALGVSTSMLRRWDASGRLTPARTEGGQRRYESAGGPRAATAEDLASDVLEIITVFSASLYGSRSHKNQKLLDGVRQAVEEAQC